MNRGPEEHLVLACASVAGSSAEDRLRALLTTPLDWDRVIELSNGQAVLPLVQRALARIPDRVPAPVLGRFADQSRRIAHESLGLTQALLELLERFERARIRVLPFKGPTLAAQAYGDPGLRSFADLDLLVRPADLARARDLVVAAGFGPCFPTSPARRALLMRRGSHETFERADGVTVELHWRIASQVSDFDLDYDRLWSRVGAVRVAGRSVPALRPDDLLLVLCIHGTKHAWERMSWICDVAHLVRAAPDLEWDTLFAEADRMRCGRIVALGLRLARDLLDAPLPGKIGDRIRDDPAIGRLAAHVLGSLFLPPRAGAGTFRFHLGTRATWGDKLGLAVGSLTALNQHDLDVIRLPDAVLPLYYLTRPLRLAGKSLAHIARGPSARSIGS